MNTSTKEAFGQKVLDIKQVKELTFAEKVLQRLDAVEKHNKVLEERIKTLEGGGEVPTENTRKSNTIIGHNSIRYLSQLTKYLNSMGFSCVMTYLYRVDFTERKLTLRNSQMKRMSPQAREDAIFKYKNMFTTAFRGTEYEGEWTLETSEESAES